MDLKLDYHGMLEMALAEARKGLQEGGIPIGAAIFDATGKLVGAGHNRRVQQNDPSVHGGNGCISQRGQATELSQVDHGDHTGALLVLQRVGAAVWIWHARSWREPEFSGWDGLAAHARLDSQECIALLAEYIQENPAVWHEDIGEE